MVTTAWLTVQHALAHALVAGEGVLADGVVDGPEPEDVKAGWTAFALFILLALAVVVLARSLITQLRKAQRAADEGVYDERSDRGAAARGDAGADDAARGPADGDEGHPGGSGGTGADPGRDNGGIGRA